MTKRLVFSRLGWTFKPTLVLLIIMVQVNWLMSKFARSAFQKKIKSLGISLFGLCCNVRQAVANMWNCWTFLVVVWLSQRQGTGSSFYIFSSHFKMLIRYNATAFFLHKRGRLEINDSRHFESLRPTAFALIWKSLIFVIYTKSNRKSLFRIQRRLSYYS